MSTIVKLVQGSPAWHEHRRHHRNASETPAVLGLSPWMTPHQLWQTCAASGRCWWPERAGRCDAEPPALEPKGDREVACHFSRES